MGRRNQYHHYTLNGKPLGKSDREKDLGILVNDKLTWSSQCQAAAAKANRIMGLFTSCSFEEISDDAFLKLKHLEYLFIENNNIKQISGNALRGLRSLIHLSLANNHLESLPSGLFRTLTAIKHIDLRGNPLHCDCQIKWLVQWAHGAGKNVAMWPPLPCEEPAKVKGKGLHELNEGDFYCVSSS
ncbi:unnamed protein product [Ranitomeya imitator]|uniref:LRRCT domain-containing protein n=1 Tax=Ranitomeya imitator TaxID=111125 RepID=A0ABN9KPX2_9NEOB|nr:unnamed protein product [Ranitomeya imitator]